MVQLRQIVYTPSRTVWAYLRYISRSGDETETEERLCFYERPFLVLRLLLKD
ncbi:hypothetical protein BN903_8 [Halorubrum sp. AJ67]|nr:hypothetical protein BN903_8 [Halorubrum sp. AJ67]